MPRFVAGLQHLGTVAVKSKVISIDNPELFFKPEEIEVSIVRCTKQTTKNCKKTKKLNKSQDTGNIPVPVNMHFRCRVWREVYSPTRQNTSAFDKKFFFGSKKIV